MPAVDHNPHALDPVFVHPIFYQSFVIAPFANPSLFVSDFAANLRPQKRIGYTLAVQKRIFVCVSSSVMEVVKMPEKETLEPIRVNRF
jgi:hypothetical protein